MKKIRINKYTIPFCLLLFLNFQIVFSQETPTSKAENTEISEEFKIKREEIYEFAQKPTVVKDGDKVTITFETKAFCDVSVALEDSQGNIVCHLACGVLGPKAPAPFAPNSKKQTIFWDCKNDQGAYIDNKDDIIVRVSLGLKPQYEKPLFYEPKKRVGTMIPLLRATEEGVYVFDTSGADHLRLFSHEGTYIRTIYPFPASKLNDVKGLEIKTYPQDGKKIPAKKGSQESTLLTSGTTGIVSHKYKLGNGIGAFAMDVRDKQIALAGFKLNRLATDGSSGGLSLYGPDAYVFKKEDMKLDIEKETWVPPTSIAFSPDKKWIYMTGFIWTSSIYSLGCHHVVMRMEYASEKPAEIFIGNLDIAKFGSENGQFNCPSSVECDAEGRVYVSDYMNDRIQIFTPEGKYLKSIATPKPALIRLNKLSGELYCFSWAVPMPALTPNLYGAMKIKPTLTIFGNFADPKKLSEYDLPLPPVEGWLHGPARRPTWYTAEIDPWAKSPVIWLGKEAINNQDYGLASGNGGKTQGWEGRAIQLLKISEGKLEKVDDFGEDTVQSIFRAKPPAYLAQKLYTNPKTHKLYLFEGDADTAKSVTELLEIDQVTGKAKPINYLLQLKICVLI